MGLTHLPASHFLKNYLAPWATQIAGRFGYPVYLVGSALTLPEPRDIDVRCIVPTADFKARYGDPKVWSRGLWMTRENGAIAYAADMADLSREAALALKLNLDFQVQPPLEAHQFQGFPRLRLDALNLPELDLDAIGA